MVCAEAVFLLPSCMCHGAGFRYEGPRLWHHRMLGPARSLSLPKRMSFDTSTNTEARNGGPIGAMHAMRTKWSAIPHAALQALPGQPLCPHMPRSLRPFQVAAAGRSAPMHTFAAAADDQGTNSAQHTAGTSEHSADSPVTQTEQTAARTKRPVANASDFNIGYQIIISPNKRVTVRCSCHDV